MPEIAVPDFAKTTANPHSRQLAEEKNPAQQFYRLCCMTDGLNDKGQPTTQVFFDDGPFEAGSMVNGVKVKGSVDEGVNHLLAPPSARRQHLFKMLRKKKDGHAVWAAIPFGASIKLVEGEPRVVFSPPLARGAQPVGPIGPWHPDMMGNVPVPLVTDELLAACVAHGKVRDEIFQQVVRNREAKANEERKQRDEANAGIATAAAQGAAAAVAAVMKQLAPAALVQKESK